MSRYLRLGYVLPRLALLAALYLLAEHGSGWALRWAIVGAGERAVGARVELDRAEVSVLKTRVSLAGFRAADPGDPMTNAVEFDRLELDFDSNALLRRKLVADHGSLRGLRFGAPRETSGALEARTDSPASEAPAWLAGATGAAARGAEAWVADLEAKFSGEVGDLASVRLVNDLRERWPKRFQGLAAEAEALEAEVRQLKALAKEARANPLRHADFLSRAPQLAASLRQRLADLQAEIASLPADVAADREQVEVARRRDEALLRQRLQVDQLDPQALTTALLGESVAGPLRELVAWVRWSRAMAPAKPKADRLTPRSRGVDVRFAGVAERPDLLVRELTLEGAARVGGRPVELRGLVSDFTTVPSLHGEPMRVAMTATGGLPMEIRATIDRTAAVPRDELLIDCPMLGLPGATLGQADRFALKVAPSSASLSVSLRVEGEQLAGEVQVVQDQVSLTPVVGAQAGKVMARLGEGLSDSLASVSRPATRVTIGGTLDRPDVDIWSTLGPAVAQSLQGAAMSIARDEGQRQLANAQQKVAAEMASLDRLVGETLGKLTAQVEAPRQEIERLAANAIGEQLGRGTSAFEQLGKRLPLADSLFK